MADQKVTGRVVKIRCKHCGALIVLKGSGASGVRSRSPEPGPAVALDAPAVASPPPPVATPAVAPPVAAVPPPAPRIATPVAAPVETRVWHVAIGREKRGPLTFAEVGDLVRSGAVTERSYAWKSGMAAWEHLGAIAALHELLPKPAPRPVLAAVPAPKPAPAPAPTPIAEDADVTIADVSLESLAGPGRALFSPIERDEEPTVIQSAPAAPAASEAAPVRSEDAGLTEEAPVRFEGDLLDFLSDVEVDPRTGLEIAAAPAAVETPVAATEEPRAPVEEPKAPVEVATAPIEEPKAPVEEVTAPVEEPKEPVAPVAEVKEEPAPPVAEPDEIDDGGEIIELLNSNDLLEEEHPREPATAGTPPPLLRIRESSPVAAPDEVPPPPAHVPDDHEERFFLAAEQVPHEHHPHIEEEASGPGPAVDESFFPGGHAPIIDVPTVAVRPSRKEVKGMIQEFSLMIRLNKRSNRRTMITMFAALVVIAAAVGTVLYIEKNRVAADLGAYGETDEGSITVMEEATPKVRVAARGGTGRLWRDAQTKTMVEEIDYRELNAKNETQPEIKIEVKAPVPEKGPAADSVAKTIKIASDRGTPGGPAEKKLTPEEYEKLMKDEMGKRETKLELPAITDAAKKSVVDDAEVNGALRAHSKDYFRCHKSGDPIKVRIVVTVDPSGSVSGSTVDLTPGPDPVVEGCMRAIVSKLRFAPSVNGGRGSLSFLLQ